MCPIDIKKLPGIEFLPPNITIHRLLTSEVVKAIYLDKRMRQLHIDNKVIGWDSHTFLDGYRRYNDIVFIM